MAKRAAREQVGFDIGATANGASCCPDCGAPDYERHASGCPLAVTDGGVVDANSGGFVLSVPREVSALARELESHGERRGVVMPSDALNARVCWSTDAIGTWFFLMDGDLPVPLGVFGADRVAERDRLIGTLTRAVEAGHHTGDRHGS